MKVLINDQLFGGFRIKDEVIKKIWGDEDARFVDKDKMRVNAELIAMKERGEDIEGHACHLVVVELPEGWTDWTVTEYDGLETLYAMTGSKIFWGR